MAPTTVLADQGPSKQQTASREEFERFVNNLLRMAGDEVAKKHEHSEFLARLMARAMLEAQ